MMLRRIKNFFINNFFIISVIIFGIIGLILGLFLRIYAELSPLEIKLIGLPGELLNRVLKLIILPIFFTNLITGMINLTLNSTKVTLVAMLLYLISLVCSTALSLLLVLLIRPGDSFAQTQQNELNITISSNSSEPIDQMHIIFDLFRYFNK